MDASHDNYKRESYGSKNESIRSECESDEPLENSGKSNDRVFDDRKDFKILLMLEKRRATEISSSSQN